MAHEELERAETKIREAIAETYDIEVAHAKADDALCEFLASLGYRELVALWREVPKWYA